MSKRSRRLTRREFMKRAALAGGTLALATSGRLAGAQGQPPKLGAQLIGKLEGPELILDPAKWPKTFSEAPMLADLVKQGKLPPVTERVPKEPLVIKPVQSIGRYGGRGAAASRVPVTRRTATGSFRQTSSCSGSTRAPRSGRAWRASGS